MNGILHVDGGSRGNPGPAGCGIVIRDADTHQVLYEAGHYLGPATNNVAEYQGLLRALAAARDLGLRSIAIRSDSELMVRQLTGQYRVKSPGLKPLFEQVRQRLSLFQKWQIQYVPREQNQRADELANLAMDAQGDLIVTSPGGRSGSSSGANPGTLPGAGTAAAAGKKSNPSQTQTQQSPTPCWTAQLTGPAGRCVVGQSTGNAYTFGPTTPEGFCVHAAAAVLAQGPLQWPASQRTGQTRCQRCGLAIQLERLA